MIDDELTELPKSALRDYSDDPRIDRIWHRLEGESSRRPTRPRSAWILIPAFGGALFLAGVFVGRATVDARKPMAELAAEPVHLTEPARERPAAPTRPFEPLASAAPADHRRPSTPSRATSGTAVERATDESSRVLSPPAPVASAPSVAPEWQVQADSGDFGAARAAIERTGGWDRALVAASPEQLMTLVDVGRASGEREQAVRALRRLLDAFPGAPEAPLAAWTLGNLLEQSGDRAGAAAAYALYRHLSPGGDFAEDAAARQVDVALSQGDLERATELVDQYARDFPGGRRLSEFREELQKLQADSADAGEPQHGSDSKPAVLEGPAPVGSASASALPQTAPTVPSAP